MTVRIGVIGTGLIGQNHIRRITDVLSEGDVVAVTDIDAARAQQVAAILPAAAVHVTGHDLIANGDVDAVLVAAPGPAHEEYVLGAIAAGKPVFCEKPLAPTGQACHRIVEAEISYGRPLVQVGFMRRYDARYRALKGALDGGEIGAPLLMHCAHRNPSIPSYGFTTDLIISDSAVHEIDLVRWLFAEDIVATSILKPRRSRQGHAELQDPLIVLLEMASGVLVDVEAFANAGYGYDIRGEIVGECGTLALAEADGSVLTRDGRRSGHIPANYRERFGQAYDAELRDWLKAVAAGTSTGPSAWDGYAVAIAVESCLTALRTGGPVAVSLPDRPDFYAK